MLYWLFDCSSTATCSTLISDLPARERIEVWLPKAKTKPENSSAPTQQPSNTDGPNPTPVVAHQKFVSGESHAVVSHLVDCLTQSQTHVSPLSQLAQRKWPFSAGISGVSKAKTLLVTGCVLRVLFSPVLPQGSKIVLILSQLKWKPCYHRKAKAWHATAQKVWHAVCCYVTACCVKQESVVCSAAFAFFISVVYDKLREPMLSTKTNFTRWHVLSLPFSVATRAIVSNSGTSHTATHRWDVCPRLTSLRTCRRVSNRRAQYRVWRSMLRRRNLRSDSPTVKLSFIDWIRTLSIFSILLYFFTNSISRKLRKDTQGKGKVNHLRPRRRLDLAIDLI